MQGRSLKKVTDYSYDEFGNVTEEKVSFTYENYGMDRENAICTYDNEGRLRREEITQSTYLGDKLFTFDYDENGAICHIEVQDYESLSTYDFDAEGYCLRYTYEVGGIGKAETQYEYDADHNLAFMSICIDNGTPQTMTPVYEDGRQVATKHVAPDGGEVMEYFRYDEEGRLTLIEYDAAEPHKSNYFYYTDFVNGEFRYNEYKAGDQHITISFRYNDLGFVNDAEWRTNGNFVAWTQYSYPPDDNDGYGYSLTDNDYGPYIVGGTLSSSSWYSGKTYTSRGGNPTLAYTYELKIMGDDPRYVKSTLDCEYENVSVKVEMLPQADLGEFSVKDFYPDMRESYLGTPVPTPDGSKRLIRVEMVSFPAIPVVAELAYAADGSLAGAETYFDFESFAKRCSWQQDSEFDEQGRVSYVPPMYGDFHIRYADDGQAYTIIYSSGYESEIRLEDSRIQDWVKRGPLDYYDSDEVNEDGLLTKKVLGPDNVMEYSYHWETNLHNWETGRDDNTSLKDNYNEDIFLFDAHGYLLEHCVPHSAVFNYTYE